MTQPNRLCPIVRLANFVSKKVDAPETNHFDVFIFLQPFLTLVIIHFETVCLDVLRVYKEVVGKDLVLKSWEELAKEGQH